MNLILRTAADYLSRGIPIPENLLPDQLLGTAFFDAASWTITATFYKLSGRQYIINIFRNPTW